MDTIKTSWYPGHMARAFSLFKKEVKKAQVVIEVIDARIPGSSRNTRIGNLLSGKRRIVVLNKTDLAPVEGVRAWGRKIASSEDAYVIPTNLARDAKASAKVLECLERISADLLAKKSRGGMMTAFLKIVVIGIPNVGKSTLINRLVGRNRVRVGKQPGITVGPQWISFGKNYELLDMPGILEPDLDDPAVAGKLSMTYAVSDRVVDPVSIAEDLIAILRDPAIAGAPERSYPVFKNLRNYKDCREALSDMAMHFNLIGREGRPDLHRMACKILKDYRDGLLGKFILDRMDAAPEGGSVL